MVTARPFHTSGTRSTVPAASTVPGDSGLTARQPAGSSEAGTSPRGTEVNSRTSRATVVRSSTWWRTTGVWTTHTSTDQRVSQRTAIVRWGTPSTLATTATTMGPGGLPLTRAVETCVAPSTSVNPSGTWHL